MGTGELQQRLKMVTGSPSVRPSVTTSSQSLIADSRPHFFDATQEQAEWGGPAVEPLKLEKTVKQLAYNNLAEGFYPDGARKLVQNAGDFYRQAILPLLFILPKALSVLISQAPEKLRAELIECAKCSVKAGMDYFQEVAALTRRGEGGRVNERALILWASFLQYESRLLDPHIHFHVDLFLLSVRQDGTAGSLRSIDFYREIKAASAIFEADLASRLIHQFGLTIIAKEKGGFDIQGVPNDLCEEFSKRHAAIEQEKSKHGGKSAESGRIAALNTRPDKEIVSHEALFARWQKTGRQFGFSPEQASELLGKPNPQNKTTVNFAKELRTGIAKLEPKEKTRPAVIELGRTLAIEHGASGEDLKEAFKENLPKKPGFVHIEWKQVYPKSAFWSPTRLVKTPRIVIGNPKKYVRWGNIRYQKDTVFGRVRIQERILASKAPSWSPFCNKTIPALRFGKMRLTEKELWAKTRVTLKVKGGEFRIQDRRIFPRALIFNPARNIAIPVPRFVETKSKQKPASKTKKKNQQNSH